MKFFFRPTKEMVLILVIALLPVLVFGIIAVNRSVEVAQKAAENEDRILTANLANQTNLYLLRAEDLIRSLASFPFQDIDENSLGAVYENNSFQGIPMFESLIVLDDEGILINIYPFREEVIGLDYSRQTFFDSVKREERIFFSRVTFSSVSEQPVVGIAAPIFEQEPEKRLVGVIQGSIRLQGLSSLVREFGIARRTGQAFLVNQFGEIIAHPDYHLIKEQENIANINPGLAVILQAATKDRDIFQYSTPQGIEYLVSFQTISRTGWKLVIQQEMEEVLATPSRLRQFLLIILAITFSGAGVISHRVASYIIYFRKRLEEAREERLRQLKEMKDILEIKVRARTTELEELTQSLEKQVKGRTKELQEKLAEMERFQRLAVGRELKMIELKEEIKKLKEELEKYKPA